MKKINVLILEDRQTLRELLSTGFNELGLNAVAAESVQEARALVREMADVDVAILDINLGPGPIETGLDFGMELRTAPKQKDWPPEFLIYSAFDNPDYYQTALALGAAGYLRKGSIGGDPTEATHLPRVEVLVQHVRALALRRALHSERPGMAERLESIAEASGSREEAVERFCRDVLVDVLESTLGGDCLVLLTSAGDTVCISGRDQKPVSSALAERIQDAVHGRLGEVEPLVISTSGKSDWLRDVGSEHRNVLEAQLQQLDGAVFIALGEARTFRLSLGLLPRSQSADSVKEQLKLLDRYLQRPVIRHLLEITYMWSELELEEQKQRLLLEATSAFCQYQGQELLSIVWDAEKEPTDTDVLPPMKRLEIVAHEMRDAGQVLAYFNDPSVRKNEPGEGTTEMAEVVKQVWSREVAPRLHTAPQLLQISGSCVAAERHERAERAVSQILSWLGRRLLRLPEGEAGGLYVRCSSPQGPGRVRVEFEELSSRRLPSHLRESFFKPFYTRGMSEPVDSSPDKGRRLGLYLAETLAQMAGGSLVDRSDEIDGPLGHRFVMELPAAADVAA